MCPLKTMRDRNIPKTDSNSALKVLSGSPTFVRGTKKMFFFLLPCVIDRFCNTTAPPVGQTNNC